MSMPGPWELILIMAVMVLLFGAKKLPSLGGAIGESIKNFKKGMREVDELDKPKPDSKNDKPADV